MLYFEYNKKAPMHHLGLKKQAYTGNKRILKM